MAASVAEDQGKEDLGFPVLFNILFLCLYVDYSMVLQSIHKIFQGP